MGNTKLKFKKNNKLNFRINKKTPKSLKIKKTRLTKSWIAGLIDGEGSFRLEKVDFSNSKRTDSKPFFRPVLSISQNDPQLLYKIRDYFGCGKVTRKGEKAWHFRCRNTKDFQNFIIPRLNNAPFQTVKQSQFEQIRENAMPLLEVKNASSMTHECELLKISKAMKDSRKETSYISENPIDFDWFLGFFDGEGNFFFKVKTLPKNSIRIAFKVSQKNKNLLNKIQEFFNFGRVQSEGYAREMWKFQVEGILNVSKHGIPVFGNHPLKGKKNLERVKFLKAIRILLKEEGFVTKFSIETMRKLKKLEEGIEKVRRDF